MNKADVIILGVGGMGSAACYHLAKKGVNVIGFERFKFVHNMGSSHGQSRVIRRSYFEHENYIPLLNRAYDLWEDLEEATEMTLLHKVGLIIYGPKGKSKVIPPSVKSAQKFGIKHELMSFEQLDERFGSLACPRDFEGFFEPEAGYLEVEKCVSAHILQAQEHGADLRQSEKVLSWFPHNDSVHVYTDKGQYEAKKLVVAGGAWSGQILKDLHLPLSVHRNLLYWYDVRGGVFASIPCFAYETEYGFFYGFPLIDSHGVKVATHKAGTPLADPDKVDRNLYEDDYELINLFIKEYLPGINAEKPIAYSTCLYTMTPDEHFIVDHHPQHKNVVFAAGFSGHGFKFASVMGEILSDLSLEGKSDLDIDFLGLGRFSKNTI